MSQGMLKKLQQFDRDLPRITGFDCMVAFLNTNKMLLAYLFIAGVIAYAADIFNFSLNIDSENHAYGFGAKGGWVAQGRWGMYLLNVLLLPDAIMPVIPMLIAITGSSIGALFFLHTLSSSRGMPDYLAGPIAIACPIIYFAFYFTTLGYGVGIAFALTGIGMYMLTRWTWQGAVIAVFCFCFGIGIYQAVLPLIATLFCLYLVASVIEQQITLTLLIKRVGIFFVVLIVAYVAYELVKRWSLHYMGIAFDTGYISSFMSYQLNQEYFLNAFKKTVLVAIDYYAGGKNYYLYDLLSLKILFMFVFYVSLVRISFSQNSFLVRVVAVLALLSAIVAPMTMHMLNNGYMPPRTVLGVPQVLAAMVFFTVSSRSKFLQTLAAILAVSCFYNFSVINNRYALSNAMVWQADRELSLLIMQRINEVLHKIPPKNDIFAQYPLELVGWSEYLESPIIVHREVIGASFYTWGAGDVERTERLFRTMGVFDYRAATQQERLSVVQTAEKMPVWPYEGSVDVVNGVIVVKFREYNPNQFISMCRPPLDVEPVCVKNMPR